MKPLAVIILNWNGLELLKQLLPINSRFTVSEEADLIVADNGSSDGSVEWVKSTHPEVKVLEFPENLGFAAGYNEALRLTGYEYTVLLNSDVETTEGWWRPLLDFMRSTPEAGACQPKIKSWKERTKFEYAGAAGGYLDRWGYPYCRGRLLNIVEEDRGQYDDQVADVTWASGAALCVRTELYLRLGGLDADFFAHMEEIDLCCRMIGAGYRVCALSGSEIYHMGGATLPQGNPKKVYLNFRNNLLLLHKNLPEKKGKRVLFVRRLIDTLAMGLFLVKGNFRGVKAIWDAHRDFRKMRGNYTGHPDKDFLSTLPGSDKMVMMEKIKSLEFRI